MRSQGDGNLVQHRKTDQNKEDVEEDEDEEYGVRRSVKKLDPREPSKEREDHEKTHLPSQLVPTLRERARQRGGLPRRQEGSGGGRGALGLHVHGRRRR